MKKKKKGNARTIARMRVSGVLVPCRDPKWVEMGAGGSETGCRGLKRGAGGPRKAAGGRDAWLGI